MILLLHSLGIIPDYREESSLYTIKITEKESLLELKNLVEKKHQKRITDYLENPQKNSTNRLNDDVYLTTIQSIQAVASEKTVYSLEIDKNNTFITDHGLIVHNCFPKDVDAFVAISDNSRL